MASLFDRGLESPRRRRTRPRWNHDEQDLQDSSFSALIRQNSLSSEHSSPFVERSVSTAPSNETERELSAQSSNRRKIYSVFLIAIGCLLVALHAAGENPFMENRNIEITQDTGAGLRRRLEVNRKLKSYHSGDLHYLSLGGPLTYGRGLDKHMRLSEAYPHRLSTNGRNLAYPNYEASGPTMASLCTQSIVEESTETPFIEYDVITLEYSFVETDTTKEVYLSSMALLVQRLRQRYPQATIVLVRIFTPSDLVYVDSNSNKILSYNEWRNSQWLQHTTTANNYNNTMVAPIAWTLRRLSETEQQVQEQMEATMASVGGLVATMPQIDNWNAHLDDWFLEESNPEKDGRVFFRYTLSANGHAVVAKSIRDAVRKHRSNGSKPAQIFSASPADQLLFSWGSGDACHLWYDTGQEGLPADPNDYSGGLSLREIGKNSYALEVTLSQGGTLKVYNPFDSERLVYLTYLTASGLATSNKVYPKTKVKMVAQQQQQDNSQTNPSKKTTSVLLDPSHDVATQHRYHYTQTSAVGMVSSHHTGIFEFTTLEEYTVHPFRIVGVSILQTPEHLPMPLEKQLFAPRQLSVDNTNTIADVLDDDTMIHNNQ